MPEIRRIEEVVNADGWIETPRHCEWDCERCGEIVVSVRGDVGCDCGAQYNAAGQRLRDDWRGNPSCWDDDISDLDGYEMQHLREEYGDA